MKNPSVIHSLARPNQFSGKIRFIHSDGKEHSFASVINDMSGSRLSYFDSSAPTIDDTKRWILSVVRDIKKKATVLEVIGDFQ